MKKHPILYGFLILLAIVYISNAYNSMRYAPPSPTQTQATRQTSSGSGERVVEMARGIVERNMPGATIESRYDKENEWAFIDVIQPGMNTDFIQKAKDDVGDYHATWNEITKRAVDIQKSLQEIFVSMKMEDTVVVLDILNADNPDEVFLSVANGIVGYDVVNEIDLLNQMVE